MVGTLRAVVVKRPEQAFRGVTAINAEWKELGWTRLPNLEVAAREHRQLVSLLEAAGARVYFLPEDSRTNLDSIYVHDPVAGNPITRSRLERAGCTVLSSRDEKSVFSALVVRSVSLDRCCVANRNLQQFLH